MRNQLILRIRNFGATERRVPQRQVMMGYQRCIHTSLSHIEQRSAVTHLIAICHTERPVPPPCLVPYFCTCFPATCLVQAVATLIGVSAIPSLLISFDSIIYPASPPHSNQKQSTPHPNSHSPPLLNLIYYNL